MEKGSSYQKLKNKIKHLEKDIYNMAQQDDLILACTTMTEKRLYIDLNKVLWNGNINIDHNFKGCKVDSIYDVLIKENVKTGNVKLTGKIS